MIFEINNETGRAVITPVTAKDKDILTRVCGLAETGDTMTFRRQIVFGDGEEPTFILVADPPGPKPEPEPVEHDEE